MNTLDCAVKRVLDSTIVTEGNKNLVEMSIKKVILEKIEEMNLKKVPDFFVDLLVLNKMKEIYAEEKESRLVLQRNLTLKEMRFLREEGIKIFFGDFEVCDEELIISDFEDKVYLLDYDSEKSFLYAQAFRFTVEENFSNSFVS